jgi:hypothetical protein
MSRHWSRQTKDGSDFAVSAIIEVKQEKGAMERLTLADQPLQGRDSFFGFR